MNRQIVYTRSWLYTTKLKLFSRDSTRPDILENKIKINALFEANNMINIILDKNNNQYCDYIINMTVLIKNY